MTKHLVDIDDARLEAGRAEFGTTSIKATVDEALRRATADRTRRIAARTAPEWDSTEWAVPAGSVD